ncbi:serine O-acetyltransferase [Lyngbya sp. PCC 8106]|uniref:serine O-acetyltransferase n=1 Tax=Lyngbya sp. (strain PCC 8106) TaxID=313612 RepID=UPI0000EAD19E|nr:serine O-acetyltransferase [Lyngbya sp. PCC 8106]EAW38328.1 hexapeptide transferase family protein [Lyngbya sp. PCC 8106]
MLDLFEALKVDIDRYVYTDSYSWLMIVLFKQGIWATIQYRFSRWVHIKVHVPVIRQLLKAFCAIWQKLIEIITGMEIPNRAEIGKGLYIPHTGGIYIHCDVKIGDYCNLSQEVTIGVGGRGEKKGCPQIGDQVYIAPGAKIFGPITIGNDVAIGANAVVTKDLPDNAVAVGIPAKVINYKGSQDFIKYRDKPESSVNTPMEKLEC